MYHKWSRSGRLDLFLFCRKKKTRLKRQWQGKERRKKGWMFIPLKDKRTPFRLNK